MLVTASQCVNALGGLFSFLLFAEGMILAAPKNVSMPSAGYSHFYGTFEMDIDRAATKCQCPRRAILISTSLEKVSQSVAQLGVNALGGLFSFLPNVLWWSVALAVKRCQCPRRAILISTEDFEEC